MLKQYGHTFLSRYGHRLIGPLLLLIAAVTIQYNAHALPDLTKITGSPLRPTSDWESNIARIERNYSRLDTEADSVVFVGSSSIVRWITLAEDFPDIRVINAGFGGSQIIDSVYYADRIVIPFAPHTIVFFAGSNDISAGKTPTRVLADYKAFVDRVHEELPQTMIVFISISTSPRRWSQHPLVIEANRLIQLYTETDDRLAFVDIYDAMLGPDGMPLIELYDADELHLSPKGYELWVEAVRPYLTLPHQPLTLLGPERDESVMGPVTLHAQVSPRVDVSSARVTIGDIELYADDKAPAHPIVSPYLPDGRHLAVFEITDVDQNVWRRSLRVTVRNVGINFDHQGPAVQDEVEATFTTAYDPSDITGATVTLTPIRVGLPQHDEEVTLYEGDTIPDRIVLDTLQFDDATYDMTLTVETSTGHLSQDAQRLVIRNWQKMTDPFAAPQESGWFGIVDRKKTIFESPGWDYATDEREAFFGDGERRIWTGEGRGDLIWEVPALNRFVVTLYAQDADLSQLTVSTSTDQADWQTVPFDYTVVEGPESAWNQVLVTGSMVDGSNIRYVRLTLSEALNQDIVQLGEVEFIYPADRTN